MAEIYRAQSNPGGSTALGGASAEDFGAGIGRGLEQAGHTVRRMGERLKARERDKENTAAALEFARISNDLDKAEIDGRNTAEPGAAGHTAKIVGLADERINNALGGIKDEELRAKWAPRFEELKGNADTRAYAFEAASNAELLVTNAQDTTRELAAGQALNPDGLGLQNGLEAIRTMYDGLGISDAGKEKGIKADQRVLALAYASAMADRDPDAFLGNDKEKRTGILNLVADYLEPEDIDRLRTRGQAELARLEAKERQQAALEEAAWREDFSALSKRISVLGDLTVTDEQFDAMEAGAAKYGDKSALIDIANLRSLQTVSLETRDYTPAQWEAAVGAIEKIDPTKRTAAQSLRLKHLEQLRGPAQERFNSDPHGWANNAGTPPPAIDWENPTPAQGSARASWNRAFMRATGSPSALLAPQELNAFRQRAESGPAGKIEVAQQMRTMFGVADAKLALQQIDKDDPNLAVMVNLPANTAKDYQLGIEALKRNSKFAPKELGNEIFSEYGSAVPPVLRGPVWDAARAIAAAELDRAGNADPDDDEYRSAFRRGVQRALGATGTKGGIVRWIDTPIWIPPEMDKSDALRRLSRAKAEDLIAANTGPNGTGGGGAPYYMGANGKPVPFHGRAIELLRKGELESIAPGVFRVVLEDGGHVINKNGGHWQFDIRKLK